MHAAKEFPVAISKLHCQLSLAESSFDAWIRLYRPDANTRNSSQNYYVNGAVAALCLDMTILRESGGERCLDDVLRELWRATFTRGRGYTLDDVERAIQDAGGSPAVAVLRKLTQGALDPNVADFLDVVGVTISQREAGRPHLGITFKAGGTTIGAVTNDLPAHAAGLAPGDEILALQQLRVAADTWTDVLAAVAAPEEALEVLFARRGLVQRCVVVPAKSPGTIALKLLEAPSPQQARAREVWLRRVVATTSPAEAGATE